jgi:predicted DNA-binding protein (MmcQ/YjbR family)
MAALATSAGEQERQCGWRHLVETAEDRIVTPEAVEAHCLSLPAATLSIQWGGTHVFKVGGKIFAMTGGGVWGLSFKASDMAFELLQEQKLARPAPYLQRAKWLQLLAPDALGDADLKAYLTQAHAIVSAKLTRRLRAELGLGLG